MKLSKIWRAVGTALFGACVFGLAAPSFSSPVIVERNLFSPDRKPPSPDSATSSTKSSKPSVPPKALQLDGIIIHGETRKALIRVKGQMPGKDKGKDNSPFVSVREGEKISDYVVNKIGLKSISVEKDGETFELYLYASGKVLPPMAPPPPPQDAAGGVNVPGGPREPRARPGQPPQPGAAPEGNAPGEISPEAGGANVGQPSPGMSRRGAGVNPNPAPGAEIPAEEIDEQMDQEEDGEE